MTTPEAFGPEISRHAYDKTTGCIGLVLTAMCAGIGVFMLGAIVFDGSSTAAWSDLCVGLSCSGFFLAIGLGMFGSILRETLQGLEVVFHEGGVVVDQRSGSKSYRWGEFPRVKIERVNRRGTIYETITLGDGEGVGFELAAHSYTGIGADTVRLVTDKHFEQFWPWYADKLDKGETVDFGVVKVSEKGFDDGSGLVPWSEVQDMDVAGVAMVLRLRDGSARSFIVHGLTNAHILLHIVAVSLEA